MLRVLSSTFTLAFGADFTFWISDLGLSQCHSSLTPFPIWLRVNQIELLDNPDKRQTGITFEADIIDHDKVDLSIKLQLTERVIVKDQGNGKLDISIADEPQPEVLLTAGHWDIYLRDQLLASWDVPAQ
jgi:hypothetical protein